MITINGRLIEPYKTIYDKGYQQGKADALDKFAEDILNQIKFEEKWLFDCKSGNADTGIMISALKNYVKSRAKQLKE